MSKPQRDITPRWLDLHCAAQYASLSRKTLLRYVHAGEIVGNRVGGKWILDRNSLDSFMMASMLLIATKARNR